MLASAPSPIDTDREGALVTTDRCPTARETVNGFQDADGCPDELPADLRSIPGPVTGLEFAFFTDAAVLPRRGARLEHVLHVIARYPAMHIDIIVRDPNPVIARRKAEAIHRDCSPYNSLDPRWTPRGIRDPTAKGIELTIAASPDTDADGFANGLDVCPTAPGDGISPCPAPDPDGDNLDAPDDRCPTLPETLNGYQDADGCPDAWPADLMHVPGILTGVAFKPNRSTLEPTAYPTLDRLAILLTRYPDIRLEISGHRQAGDDYSSDIKYRQETVKRYLVERGIAADRLETRNAGADEPIDTNKTAAGRRRNNRIELTILTEGPPP